MAEELAREIIDQSQRRDRPSHAAITLKFHCPCGSSCKAAKITAPTVDGKLLLQITFDDSESLQYNARDNLDAAAACVAGFAMSQSTLYSIPDAEFHTVAEDGSLSQELFRWTLLKSSWPKEEKGWDLEDKLKRIFRALFADSSHREE